MKPLRAVGVALLSLVDALIPSALTALVFVATLAVGFALTMVGHGPFPVTRATKRVWQWWYRPWFTGRCRGR